MCVSTLTIALYALDSIDRSLLVSILALVESNFVAATRFSPKSPRMNPLCMAVDDTKLASTIRTFENPQGSGTCIIGQTGEPVRIAHDDLMAEAVVAANKRKGTKVCHRMRFWDGVAHSPEKLPAYLLSTNRPRIPLILVAACVVDSCVGQQLFTMANQVFACLDRVGSLEKVISVSTNGASNEMKVHDMVEAANPSISLELKATSRIVDAYH